MSLNKQFFSEYLKWFIAQYHTFVELSTPSYAYKIVKRKENNVTGEEKFVIQLTNKKVFFELSPEKIVLDEKMLRGFSPLDIRTITYYACKKMDLDKIPKKESPITRIYRVVAQVFSRHSKQEMITLENEETGNVISQPVQTISNSPEMIDKMSPKDAHLVGFVAGSEVATKDTCN